jgi:hypothetical protein
VASKGEKERQAAEVLERQSFPVLIILGMDADDLGLRFAYRGGAFFAFEPVLKFRQTMRWVPVQQPDAVMRSHYGSPYDPKNQRYWDRLEDRGLRRGISESERMRWMRGLDLASGAVPVSREEYRERILRLMESINRLESSSGAVTLQTPEAQALGWAAEALLEEELWRHEARTNQLAGNVHGRRRRANRDRPVTLNGDDELLSNDDLANASKLAREKVSNLRAAGSATLTAKEATDVSSALYWLMNKRPINGVSDADLVAAAQDRIGMLGAQALGSWNYQAIPLDVHVTPADAPVPAVDFAAEVRHAYRDRASAFIVTGKNLSKDTVRSATVGGMPIKSIEFAGKKAVIVTFEPPPPQAIAVGRWTAGVAPVPLVLLGPVAPAFGVPVPVVVPVPLPVAVPTRFRWAGRPLPKEPVDLVLATSDGAKLAAKVQFDLPPERPDEKTPGVSIVRDAAGRVTEIRINKENRQVGVGDLLGLIREAMREKPDLKIDLGVSGDFNVKTRRSGR